MLEKLIPLIQGCKEHINSLKAKIETPCASPAPQKGHHKKSASISTQIKFTQNTSLATNTKFDNFNNNTIYEHKEYEYQARPPKQPRLTSAINNGESKKAGHIRTKSDFPTNYSKQMKTDNLQKISTNIVPATKQKISSANFVKKDKTFTTPSSPAKNLKNYAFSDTKVKLLFNNEYKNTNISSTSKQQQKENNMTLVIAKEMASINKIEEVLDSGERKIMPLNKSDQKLAGWHKRCASGDYAAIPTESEQLLKNKIQNTNHCPSSNKQENNEILSKKSSQHAIKSVLDQDKLQTVKKAPSAPGHRKTASAFTNPASMEKILKNEIQNKENAGKLTGTTKFHQYESLSKTKQTANSQKAQFQQSVSILSKKPSEDVLKVAKGYFMNPALNSTKIIPTKVCTVLNQTSMNKKTQITKIPIKPKGESTDRSECQSTSRMPPEFIKESLKIKDQIKNCIFYIYCIKINRFQRK